MNNMENLNFIELFTSTSNNSIYKKVEEKYFKTIIFLLGKYISDQKIKDLDNLLLTLPVISLKRVTLSPIFCNYIINWQKNKYFKFNDFLYQSLIIEHFLNKTLDEKFTLDKESWSATRDIKVSRSGKVGMRILKEQPNLYISNISFDWKSNFQKLNNNNFIYIKHSNDIEAYKSIEKIQVAEKIINLVFPNFIQLIKNNIITIKLCSDDVNQTYTSSSSRSNTGRVALINAHLCHVDIPTLINALIHEAIHNFFYRIEYMKPFVNNINDALNLNIESPWSKKMITLPTYIHACYIYYALKNFWKEDSLQHFFNKDIISKQLFFLSKGNKKNYDIARKKEVIELTDPFIIKELHEIYNKKNFG